MKNASISRIIADFLLVDFSIAIIIATAVFRLPADMWDTLSNITSVCIFLIFGWCYVGAYNMIASSRINEWIKWVFSLITPFLYSLQVAAYGALNVYQSFENTHYSPFITRRVHTWSYKRIFIRIISNPKSKDTLIIYGLFLIMFTICVGIAASRSSFVYYKYLCLKGKISRLRHHDKSILEELVRLEDEGSLSIDAAVLYCKKNMKCDKNSKKEFLRVMRKYDCIELFPTLIQKFGPALTEREYTEFRDEYIDIFGYDMLPSECARYEIKFNFLPEIICEEEENNDETV